MSKAAGASPGNPRLRGSRHGGRRRQRRTNCRNRPHGLSAVRSPGAQIGVELHDVTVGADELRRGLIRVVQSGRDIQVSLAALWAMLSADPIACRD